ncbi:multidrug ABC transporter ATP-binding protein [Virgisporangium aliadipatigenens]|uniref:Multidrug ABC transporter ATP-binding protein n=1 Tax=Virgisporangium aliadipatigenens TaxID=741659 RepID=A0A8J3YJJ1_9ACTN|nr:multidrug ABC transporter ATP-binding protein [Virgisporangium aliadipatigenens]
MDRAFGPTQALRGLDLTVPYGQVTGLVGANGAGKTTLLLILATLLAPDAGHVRVAGIDPATDPLGVRARMGWMPDVFGLYDQLTVREYLDFTARAYRLTPKVAQQRIDETLVAGRLEDLAGQPVHTLSRGQKQRLALGRALLHGPRVLLLDEPAAGLDPRSRVDLRDTLRALAESGVAVVVSSHILGELEEIADRVAFISGGRCTGEYDVAELSAATQRPWRIRALHPEPLVRALGDLGYTDISSGDAGIEVPPLSEEAAADLLTALVGAGVRVVAFQPVGSGLETAYLALTEEHAA